MIRYDFKEEGGAEKWRNRMHSRRRFCAPWTPPSRRRASAQPRLRRAVEQYGGISAVRELCRRGQVSDGFDRLAELGRLALSAEALAVSAKFNACFTDDEVNHCFAQLCAANYFGKARF